MVPATTTGRLAYRTTAPGTRAELLVTDDRALAAAIGILEAELFPEHVTTDPWGYPVISPGPVPPSLVDHARRAVRWCPKQALHLVERNR